MLSNKNTKRKSSRNNKKTKRNNVKSKNRKYRKNTKSKTLIGGAGEPVLQQTDPPRYIYTYVATLDSNGGKGQNFNKPVSITISHDNRIYVCDKNNNRVQIFNGDTPNYTYIGTLGKSNKKIFSFMDDTIYPSGVAVSDDNRIYVADDTQNVVIIFNGKTLKRIKILKYLNMVPLSVAVSSTDNRLYVLDGKQCSIYVFNNKSYEFLFIYGYRCNKHDNFRNSFYNPVGITVSPSDNLIYVADTGNHQIKVFDSTTSSTTLTYIKTITPSLHAPITNNLRFYFPNSVAVSTDNFIYIADTTNHRVQVFNDNIYINTLGIRNSSGSSNTQFNNPVAVAVSQDGKQIYVVDRDNNRVQVFDKTELPPDYPLPDYPLPEYKSRILMNGYTHNKTMNSNISRETNLPSPNYVALESENAAARQDRRSRTYANITELPI